MALWPNGRYMTRSTYKGLGVAPGGAAYIKGLGDRMNRFVGTAFTKTASTPDGYGMCGYVPPLKAGSMSARKPVVEMGGASNLLQGGPMEGTAPVASLTGTSDMSMVVSMAGTSTVVTMTGNDKVLALTIGLNGSGTISITGTGGLSMIVPFAGAGSVASLTGTSDLRGRLSLAGEWTPFTELSPEGLAAAVWGAVAAANNDAGTMGQKLNSAASGGVDYGSMADAVRTELQAELLRIVEIAKIHGLVVGADLVVTPTSRTAGDVVQTIATSGDTTTVSRP